MKALELSTYDENRIEVAVSQAAREAVAAALQEVRQEAGKRESDNIKAGRKKNAAEYNERYDLRIERYATIYGKNARVYLNGTREGYEVYQNAHRANKPGVIPQWRVKYWWDESVKPPLGYRDKVLFDWDSEDFEALIRRCAMAALGWN